MHTLAPPTARGWEVLADDEVWNCTDEFAQLAAKLNEHSVTSGTEDLVIDPTNLWLTIHQATIHTIKYKRAVGYEASYVRTSFATAETNSEPCNLVLR